MENFDTIPKQPQEEKAILEIDQLPGESKKDWYTKVVEAYADDNSKKIVMRNELADGKMLFTLEVWDENWEKKIKTEIVTVEDGKIIEKYFIDKVLNTQSSTIKTEKN